tara:strand:- start:290 stop:526 length:237 start_codon:yes stop_codon:yes gene_type:complete
MISTNGEWHTDYIAKTKIMDEQSLRFVIADCQEAINANPETPKAERYRDEILYCVQEMRRREAITENFAFILNGCREI